MTNARPTPPSAGSTENYFQSGVIQKLLFVQTRFAYPCWSALDTNAWQQEQKGPDLRMSCCLAVGAVGTTCSGKVAWPLGGTHIGTAAEVSTTANCITACAAPNAAGAS